jgi:hypothetical protein
MSVEKSDFDAVDERDIQELVEAQVPEGLRLDFKLTIYGRSDADKRELLKDISSFANSQGGHLIIGVEEAAGVATRIAGLDIDTDAEILRIEQIVRSATEPPIPGIRIRSIKLADGKSVLILRVPRSWNPPHRVTFQGINKFYTRHSAGVHEPSLEELRAMFTYSDTALEKARLFRNERVNAVISGEGLRPLVSGGRLFIHIVPVASVMGALSLDVKKIIESRNFFRPLGTDSMSPGFNFYGFINERGGDKNHGYTQVFRNGALEATKASLLIQSTDVGKAVAGLALEKVIFERLESYINGLKIIGIPVPLIVMFTLEGVGGSYYAVKNNPFRDFQPPLPDKTIFLPECVVEDYGSRADYHKAVRPAFDALWNAIGYAESTFFNEDGQWVGDQR